LDTEDQYIILWERAVEIARRENLKFAFVLYQLDNFYIELKFSLDGAKEEMRIFSRERRLTPYLEEIDLSSLDIVNL
jgi:hypothetical protein